MSQYQNDEYTYNLALQFQNELIEEIKKYADSFNENKDQDSAILKFRLSKSVDSLRQENAEYLLYHLNELLKYECKLLHHAGINESSPSNIIISDSTFDEKINFFLHIAKEVENNFTDLKNTFNNYQSELDNSRMSPSSSEDEEIENIARNLQFGVTMKEKPKLLSEIYEKFLNLSYEVTNEIIKNHLENWKQHQKMTYAVNNYVDLTKIQKWCEKVALSIRKVKNLIPEINDFQLKLFELDSIYKPIVLENYYGKLNEILIKFIEGSFIIEEQPKTSNKQVIKIENKIKAKVLLLVGMSLIDNSSKPPEVEVTAMIVSEENAKEIEKKGLFCAVPCGVFKNEKVAMAQYASKDYRGNYENMILTKIDRHTKRDVTDEKFAIVFKTTLKVDGVDIHLKLISFPIVVIVHINQEINAQATIIWDSCFKSQENVTWKDFSGLLRSMFKANNDREFTKDNLHYIAEKLYQNEVAYPIPDIFDNDLVSWQDFSKKKSNRGLTFWEWFYLCFKLIKEHLNEYWNKGFIEGFISKERVEEKLSTCPQGTFILRFSDSVKGSISIAYVIRKIDGSASIMHVNPYTSKDLEKKSLSDRLNGFEELKVLYPNIEKKVVFNSVAQEIRMFHNGYLTPFKSYRLPTN